MKLQDMIDNLQAIIDDPRRSAAIFNAILNTNDPDIIRKALELHVLLVLHDGDVIQKAINEEYEHEKSYAQEIERLEMKIDDLRRDNKKLRGDRDNKFRDKWPGEDFKWPEEDGLKWDDARKILDEIKDRSRQLERKDPPF